MKPKVQGVHRLLAADLIFRSFDKPFSNDAEYYFLIDQIAGLLAQGRAVVFVQRDGFMHMLSPHLKKP